MPLDTSSYSLALLRLDGRRWNELRRLHGQISTQAAADGSALLEMGNTKVICTVTGPEEPPRRQQQPAAQQQQQSQSSSSDARVLVDIDVAAFAGVERRARGRTDKRTQEMAHALQRGLEVVLLGHLYPHSSVRVALHVLSADGGVLAALFNAATLALVDAGVPLGDYVAACTAGSAASYAAGDGEGGADPLLDLNGVEESELPFLTVATVGGEDRIVSLLLETRVQVDRVEGMLQVGVEGCRRIRSMMDGIVREHGKRMLGSAAG